MLADGRNFLTTEWWIPVMPGIALSLTVLAANLMGDWLAFPSTPPRGADVLTVDRLQTVYYQGTTALPASRGSR